MSQKFIEGHDENIGKGEHANMPQEKMMRPYPKFKQNVDPMIDDTMSDIDSLQTRSEGKRSKYISNQK